MKKITQSSENYLKIIYQLQESGRKVHSVDVAKALGYSKASVCRALKKLKREELVTMDTEKNICLTICGKWQALVLQKKYLLIKNYLIVNWGMEEQKAARVACDMEHEY